MGHRILDEKIMRKVAEKLGNKPLVRVNEMVSRRASKLGISPEAALVIIAKDYSVGTAIYQRSLDATKQAEIRHALQSIGSPAPSSPKRTPQPPRKTRTSASERSALKAIVEYSIQDMELRKRCADLLLAKSRFDRAVNQATLVLEDRIRNKAKPQAKLVGEALVNYALKENLVETVLQVAGGNDDEQRGYTQMLRGLVPAFRNQTHHHVADKISREDALRICGFIDVILRVVDGSTKIK
jgi:uncharacterized protein (TIGR02391 family)